jgi:hypothetical protein
MRKSWILPSLSVLALTLAACNQQPAEEVPTFNAVMAGKIDPIADEVWEIGNSALGESAEMVPAKMTEQSWKDLAASAGRLRDAAKELGSLDPVVVVKPGQKIADEDVPYGDSAESVQHNIDGDTPGMRAKAKALEEHMDQLILAAQSHNAARAGELINQLDGVCESCHLDFWFPSQKKAIEEYQNAGVTGAAKQ